MPFIYIISFGQIGYFLLKLFTYIFWCRAGLLRNRTDLTLDKIMNTAVGFGLFRTVLGTGFGYLIFLLTHHFYIDFFQSLSHRPFTEFLIYLDIYIPLNLMLWGVISLLALRRMDWIWVSFAICLSLLTDIPVFLLYNGFPIGNFLC